MRGLLQGDVWFLVGLVHLVSGCDGVMLGMLEVSGEGVAVRCSVWECAVHTVLLCCVFSRMANGQWQTATAWLQPGV